MVAEVVSSSPLWMSPYTCTYTMCCREDKTFDCTSVLCWYCQIATFTPVLIHLCLSVSSSLFVSFKTKHGWRTEKDAVENARVNPQHPFRTWQLHGSLKTLKHAKTTQSESAVKSSDQVWLQFLYFITITIRLTLSPCRYFFFFKNFLPLIQIATKPTNCNLESGIRTPILDNTHFFVKLSG